MLKKKNSVIPAKVSEDTWIPTCCGICHWGPCLIKVHKVNNAVVGMEGNVEGQLEQLSMGQGRLCSKAYGLIQKLYNPNRIRGPLKRTNPEKGMGVNPKWVKISWDEALNTIAEKLKNIRERGSRRLALGYGGAQTVGLHQGTWNAFFNAFGPTQILRGGATVRCDLAEHIFGNFIHGAFHCEPDLSQCKYVLIIGRNPCSSGGTPQNIAYLDARDRGMHMVVVDPVLTATAAKADEWLPIKPGTDTAFLLGLIYVILHELNIYDNEFLKNRTNSPYLVAQNGYFLRDKVSNKVLIWDAVDKKAKAYDDTTIKDFVLEGSYTVDGIDCKPSFQVLKDHVKGYTPEWASAITDILSSTIRRIAREWVDNARIGSTIQIDGVTLPYRPVATRVGRGITGAMRSHQCVLANHILAALVGSLEVAGGHTGGCKDLPKGSASTNRGIIPGDDGMLKMDTYTFTWPPISWAGVETLLPYAKQWGHSSHLAYLNMVHPPKNFPIPSIPEAYFKYHCSPLMSIGEPAIVNEALKKIPFIVSVAYVSDETTELADIVLPEHMEFERYELGTIRNMIGLKTSMGIGGFVLRQPVVEPMYDTKDIADIFTELAGKIGMLREYNEAINTSLALTEPYELEANKKYSWIEIVDRHCKSVTNGVHDLEWFKKNSALPRLLTVEERYDVHLEMVAKNLRYPIPYMEHVKKTGEELAQNLAKVGIDWWPTYEYVPLPIYIPPITEEVSSEYDFYVTITKPAIFAWGSNLDIPWLIDMAEHFRGQTDILMSAKTAAGRGIKEGDEIWVESEVGKVKRKVKLSNGIRPDTLLIMGQYGQWTTPIAKDTGWVSEATLTPIRYSWTDHVMGSMQGNVIKAKVYKT